jgi:hypothetical protein
VTRLKRVQTVLDAVADGLAIVTGVGGLSEEIVRLAKSLTYPHTRYAIKPWLWTVAFTDASASPLHPFRFTDIAETFAANKIRNVFLTGHFPWDRLLQASLSQAIWKIAGFGDHRLAKTFSTTDARLAYALRYLASLGQFLGEIGVDHNDVILKNNPAIVAMAVTRKIAFVKINSRRDLLRLVHFGEGKNGR